MTNRTFICIAILCMAISFLQAQAPGYLGKKAILSFNYSSSFAQTGPTLSDKGNNSFYEETTRKFGFNHEFGVDFSYTLSRKIAASIGYHQYATHQTVDANDTNTGSDQLFRLNTQGISLKRHKFKSDRGALAPLGNNSYWGLKVTFIESEKIDEKFPYGILDYLEYGTPEDPNTTAVALLWGFSNQQIFLDKFVFNIGAHFSIPLNYKYYRLFNELYLTSTVYTEEHSDFQRIYKLNVLTRVGGHDLFRVNVGVGYLLF